MGPIKLCGSHIDLVGPICILTNQRECVEKRMLEGVVLTFLFMQTTSSIRAVCNALPEL